MSDQRHNIAQMSDEEKRALKGSEFFGFEFRDKQPELKGDEKPENLKSPIAPAEENEAAHIVSAGGFYSQTVDTRGDSFANERELIVKYRSAAMQPEVDQAIQDIVNESIVANDEDYPISISLEFTDLSEQVQEKIIDEFEYVMQLLNFRKYGHDIFRRWYIDGKIAYHKVIDMNNPTKGVIELRPINPIKIQKIKEIDEQVDAKTGMKFIRGHDEYFVYSENGFTQASQSMGSAYNPITGLKMPKDTVCYITSGLLDASRKISLSHLHKALRNVNQLRMMEDSLIIYRLSRAPERRVFKISTGDMPKQMAQQYINNLVQKYQNRITYNAETGETSDHRKHMHMLEDFWLPVDSNGRGTDVTNLPGGANLGEIEDIIYFQKKLYQALNVPLNRLDPESGVILGRVAEINRDEIRFQKFIDKLRIKFGELFKDILRTHLVLKGIVTTDEWDNNVNEYLIINYARDNYFSELKEAEIMRERIDTLNAVKDHIGVYFSREWARKHILKQSEEDIKEIKNQIRAEAVNHDALPIPGDVTDGMGGEFGGGEGGGGMGGDLNVGAEAPEGLGDDGEISLEDPAGAPTSLGPDDDLGEPDEDLDDDTIDDDTIDPT
jgi:hypothetical protein